jgi:hypothetical protein
VGKIGELDDPLSFGGIDRFQMTIANIVEIPQVNGRHRCYDRAAA